LITDSSVEVTSSVMTGTVYRVPYERGRRLGKQHGVAGHGA